MWPFILGALFGLLVSIVVIFIFWYLVPDAIVDRAAWLLEERLNEQMQNYDEEEDPEIVLPSGRDFPKARGTDY